MLGNRNLTAHRTARKKLPHLSGELLHIVAIQFSPTSHLPFLTARSKLTIGQTLLFGLGQGGLLNQQTLPFVALAGPAPLIGRPIWPVLKLPANQSPDERLADVAGEGLATRYGAEAAPEIRARLQRELTAISRHG